MDDRKEALKRSLDYFLPWVVLAILLTYTYARFFQPTYGIRWLADGTITRIFVSEREPTLHLSDRIVQVGSLDYRAFQADLRRDLFGNALAGTVLPIKVERDGRILTIQWQVPGTNAGEIQDRLLSQWFLAYFFWVFGTVTLLVVRPRDERWLLMTAFNYITAIWLIPGGLSSLHIWYSALVLRTAIWLSVPIYLHLHWVFPRPLGKLSPAAIWSVYALTGALVVAQWLQLVPAELFNLGFLLAAVGSLLLLITHYLRRPDLHRDLGLLLLGAFLAIVPSISLGILRLLAPVTPSVALLALLSFPILPATYLYAAYRKQLGDLELRVNRLISLYIFLIVVGAAVVPPVVMTARLPVYSPDQTLIVGVAASVVATALSLWVYPIFQRLVEGRLLGIVVPSRKLQQTYADHITGSTSFTQLSRLLQDEVMPSLLVREFVFLVFDQGSTTVLLNIGVAQEQIPVKDVQALLAPWMGQPRKHPALDEPRLAWIRLTLPLRAQDDLLGLWLFGRRDPDDTYSAIEVPILQSFANQTAIALSNILQTERLRALYQADITRHENERLSLARDLHDSVLSELAGMLMNTDMQALPRNFQDGYQALTQRLREIVSDLRPPMLSYGLKPAIEELADSLRDRSQDGVDVIVEVESAEDRYPLEVEQHVFRIVQEACENALRHSRGKRINVRGTLEKAGIDILIDDDGQGFELRKQNVQLYDLLSERHFGLAGMLERAELIGAEIRITSTPVDGTRIEVHWQPRVALPNQGSGELSS